MELFLRILKYYLCRPFRRRPSSEQATMAAWDRAAARNASRCEVCAGTAVYLCPECREPIEVHSHENDYLCRVHGFIDPIRQSDGAQIIGDGYPHPIYLAQETAH